MTKLSSSSVGATYEMVSLHVAPTELERIVWYVIYKYFAPMEL